MGTKNNLKEIMSQYLERSKVMKRLQKICKEVEDKLGFLPSADKDDRKELAILFLKGCLDDLNRTNLTRIEKAGY